MALRATEPGQQRLVSVQSGMKRCLASVLLGLAAVVSGWGATFLDQYDNPAGGVALTAGFIPDAVQITAGEPLFLTFVVSNRSTRPFHFSHVRNEMITVTATNAAGLAARSRYSGLEGNGFKRDEVVAPGRVFTSRLLLNERFALDQPGDLFVTCQCDFGYFGNRTNPVGRPISTVFKLTIQPASPPGIAAAVARWSRVVATNGALAEAAQALAELNHPLTVPPLAALVTRDPGNHVAVRALGRFTNDTAAEALALVLRRGEDYVAGEAGGALRKSGQNDRVARSFLPLLTDTNAAVRTEGARAIGWTGSALAFTPLVLLLRDPSNSVRIVAAEALGRLGDSRSFAVLTNCLGDPDFNLRLAAVKGLLALGKDLQPAWVRPVIMAGGENVRSYYQAIDLLRLHGGPRAARGLAACVHFEDPSVRHAHNFRLMLAIEFSPDGPKHYYQWHHDPNRDGTEAELADNRRILASLKAWLDRQPKD